MALTFRPDMKMIVHEVDGVPVTIVGKTIAASSSKIEAMMDGAEEADRLRAGAKARCSYVDPVGVHEFWTVITSADGLALNHRLVRLAIAVPTDAEHVQRREHVRVPLEMPVLVDDLKYEQYVCTMVDLSAGGVAVVWPVESEPIETGAMVEVRFRSERFDHHHVAQVLGPYQRGKETIVRFRFEGITNASRDRLATVVFAAQREALRQQNDGPVRAR